MVYPRTGLLLFLILIWGIAPAQISRGGTPPGFNHGEVQSIKAIDVSQIDYESLRLEDMTRDASGEPYRFAVIIPTDLSPDQAGTWTTHPGFGRFWQMKITSPGALALGLYFDRFRLPEGSSLFVYDEKAVKIIGAFTSDNNNPEEVFATEMVPGSTAVIEYVEPVATSGGYLLHLSGIAHAYRGVGFLFDARARGFGDSGPCEVNVNCSEGEAWQNEKKGVVRISVKNGSYLFWCSGSLVNNTSEDFTPYILTADHCAFYSGQYATAQDLGQWIFYFNYEAPGCVTPLQEPTYGSMTGATLVAHGGNTGSDFYLVLMDQKVPGSYDPYFNGWNRDNVVSDWGVCIQHPEGDIKKISTYDTPTVSSEWNSNGLPSHWRVQWQATAHGHGVTEGGSSGSPLFDQAGLIIGTLTGGESSCTNPNGQDYFGKFYWHWQSNGTTAVTHLNDWLDPGATGEHQLPGRYYENIVVAFFSADTTAVPVGGTVNFTDQSSGVPNSWYWTFNGGDPVTSVNQNPSGIRYPNYGDYSVTLIAHNDQTSDTLTMSKYIHVVPVVSPNPSRGLFNVFLGKDATTLPDLKIFNLLGQQLVVPLNVIDHSLVAIDLSGRSSGEYILKVTVPDNSAYYKLFLVK
jgi:hypothetical protein